MRADSCHSKREKAALTSSNEDHSRSMESSHCGEKGGREDPTYYINAIGRMIGETFGSIRMLRESAVANNVCIRLFSAQM